MQYAGECTLSCFVYRVRCVYGIIERQRYGKASDEPSHRQLTFLFVARTILPD